MWSGANANDRNNLICSLTLKIRRGVEWRGLYQMSMSLLCRLVIQSRRERSKCRLGGSRAAEICNLPGQQISLKMWGEKLVLVCATCRTYKCTRNFAQLPGKNGVTRRLAVANCDHIDVLRALVGSNQCWVRKMAKSGGVLAHKILTSVFCCSLERWNQLLCLTIFLPLDKNSSSIPSDDDEIDSQRPSKLAATLSSLCSSFILVFPSACLQSEETLGTRNLSLTLNYWINQSCHREWLTLFYCCQYFRPVS